MTNSTPLRDIPIDLSMFAISIKSLRENMTYVEFDAILRDIKDANDKGKLEDLLDRVQDMYSNGTDIHTSFHYAMFDIVHNQGDNF